MHALTVWQPWASAFFLSGKDIENRSWPAPDWLIGQRLAIHAAKRFRLEEMTEVRFWIAELTGKPLPGLQDLPFGSVIGSVLVVGCTVRASSPWFHGPFGWQVTDPQPLDEPIPATGQQKLWKWNEE